MEKKSTNRSFGILFSIVFLTEEGRIFENIVDIEDPIITINLDKKFGLNLSETSPWVDKSISVFTTLRAFLENQRVTTITIPAIISKKLGVGTFDAKTCILNSFAATPDATHAS